VHKAQHVGKKIAFSVYNLDAFALGIEDIALTCKLNQGKVSKA
jgi:hypothetical protein